jgi:hypothetical protein
MAEIKIIASIDNSEVISRHKEEDLNIVDTQKIYSQFNPKTDYIEFHLYNSSDNVISSNYKYSGFKLPDGSLNPDGTFSAIEINPTKDIKELGYINGVLTTQYNFFRKRINDSQGSFFIKEISDDRTEIRVGSIIISNNVLEDEISKIINEINNTPYIREYLLNFPGNIQVVALNAAIDTTQEHYDVFFKLYTPLPDNINLRSTFWVTEELTEPRKYVVNLSEEQIPDPLPQLRGPNFSIDVAYQNSTPTKFESYSSLSSDLTGFSYLKVANYLQDNGIGINVDYSNFENFVKFSSAKVRVENFYTKVKTIEDYNSNIDSIGNVLTFPASIQTSEFNFYSSKINDIVTGFDGFESYLYFESSSFAYPKADGNVVPTSSADVWLANILEFADNYDTENQDLLYNLIPEYVRENEDNQPYFDFINMIGHYFDNIWIYLKSVTDLYKNENNLKEGISKDLVYHALQSLGVKLYNSDGDASVGEFVLGDGTEIAKKDLLAEIYKRIYHNIPLLFKSKGTKPGLDYILNIFGVPETILGIKEYGGVKKGDTILEDSSTKIRIVDNSITGSVLSPILRLENQLLQNISDVESVDIHRIDTSFSPQNEIDKSISGSISASLGSFEIDNYIGDPRHETSGSYIDLESLRKEHIDLIFTEEYDYNGFIELIKFFDNSLFKMIKDYVPARANLSTGVTIRTQNLERIKFKRTQPNFEVQDIEDITINGPQISEDRSYHVDFIEGDQREFYTGEFDSNIPSIKEYFEDSNPNPYLVANVSHSQDVFEHSDFNVVLNNVSGSRPSTNKRVVEYGKIYGFAELQDTNESLQSFSNSRYEGSKAWSLKYNTHTDGDYSFGKTAAIDQYVRKLGLFAEVSESRFLNKRNDVALKYLVDESGSLTELNQRNKNWQEIQRTYLQSDSLVISLFENQKYSNQKLTDGEKTIFESGYSYHPVLYFSGSDSKLSFQSLQGNTIKNVEAINSLTPNGSLSGYYQLTGGKVYNIFDKITKGADFGIYATGSISSSIFPTYTVPETGDYQVTSSLSMHLSFPSGGNVSYSLQVYKNVSGTETLVSSLNQTKSVSVVSSITGSQYTTTLYTLSIYGEETSNIIEISGDPVILDYPVTLGTTVYPAGSTLYRYNFSKTKTTATVGGYLQCTLSNFQNFYSPDSTIAAFGDCYQGETTPGLGGDGAVYDTYYINSSAVSLWDVPNLGKSVSSADISFNIGANVTLNINDKLVFKLIESNPTGSYTASISSSGILSVKSLSNVTGNFPYVTDVSSSFIDSLTTNNEIVFNSTLSSFYGDYTFIPNAPGATSSLYQNYGDVDYAFEADPNDLIIIRLSDDTQVELRVNNVYLDTNNKVHIQVQPSMNANTLAEVKGGSNSPKEILLLRRLEDETNVIVYFIKRQGKTSYGLIIPNNIHPDVMGNIDTITKEVKQKLIEQSNTTNGGTS